MDVKELKEGLKIGGEIERVNGKELSYTEFVSKYMSKNQPIVITDLMDDWRASKDWVLENGRPNLHFFSTHFGKSHVQVADCYNKESSDQKRDEMTVSEFIDYWLAHHETQKVESADGCDESKLYLKDWHFVKEYPGYEAYVTPPFFRDDWLNLYLDKFHLRDDPDYQERSEISCSDYRFVYMGPKGTWTPLHADVFRSYSWSANVCGSKLWLFLPPAQHHLVFDRYLKNSVYDIFEDVSQSKFPGFKKAVWLECTQLKNEVIYVPSGWYHQVHNLEDAISINHNWFNAYNLDWVWNLLLRDYNEAKEYIEDIRDICDNFEVLCQRNLAANTGMNFLDFFTFITRMCLANLVLLYNILGGCKMDSQTACPCTHHVICNLTSIRKVASNMKSTTLAETSGIILDIRKTLEDPAFVELCADMRKTYEKLHGQCSHTYEEWKGSKIGIHDFMDTVVPHVSSSENLIYLLDHFLSEYVQLDIPVGELSEKNGAS